MVAVVSLISQSVGGIIQPVAIVGIVGSGGNGDLSEFDGYGGIVAINIVFEFVGHTLLSGGSLDVVIRVISIGDLCLVVLKDLQQVGIVDVIVFVIRDLPLQVGNGGDIAFLIVGIAAAELLRQRDLPYTGSIDVGTAGQLESIVNGFPLPVLLVVDSIRIYCCHPQTAVEDEFLVIFPTPLRVFPDNLQGVQILIGCC